MVRAAASFRWSAALPALAAMLGVSACSDEAPAPSADASSEIATDCSLPFVGDENMPLEIVVGAAVSGAFVELDEGAALPLETPPQGGHVSFVAARAKNLDPCHAKLGATLRSRTTGWIVGQEERTVNFTVPAADGWVLPNVVDITNSANVPECPAHFEESVVDVPHDLEVHVVDKSGRSANVTVLVVPSCLEPDDLERALCRCECIGGYMPGRCRDVLDGGWLIKDGGAE